MTPASLAAAERDVEANDAMGDITNNPFRRFLEQVEATAALSPGRTGAAASLNEQEAVNLMRGIFKSPNSSDALGKQRQEPEDAAGSSRREVMDWTGLTVEGFQPLVQPIKAAS